MKIGFDTFTLKIIAIVAMVLDHVGDMFFSQYAVFDMLGRIAFPIFAYLLVEGFVHTNDVKKYMLRMGVFAVLSEVPFDLAFSGVPVEVQRQNVFFTLFLGLVMLYLFQKMPMKTDGFLSAAVIILIGDFLRIDYGGVGLLMIFLFYYYREQKLWKILGIAIINLFLMGHEQIYAIFALILILLHNGKEGPKMKWLFYGVYPAHLLVLYFISTIL